MSTSSLSQKEIIKTYQAAMAEQYEVNAPFQLFEKEKEIFLLVRNGDMEGIKRLYREMIGENRPKFVGKMSKDPLKQAQFLVVSGITLATRYAISGGLPDAEAYHLSDAYLQQLTNSLSDRDAVNILLIALSDFTYRVSQHKTKETHSLPVVKAIQYINGHLHEKTSLAKIAEYCHVSAPYLSSIFHKEIGETISGYICHEKLKVSAQMLESSDFSIQRIAALLEFPSQSSFTAKFKAYYGTTPYQFRKEHIQFI